MKNINPLRAARRKAQRLAKLLTKPGDRPICLFCGCDEPLLLRPIKREFIRKHRRLFEEHHVFGRKLDVITVLALCFNCHALITEKLAQAGLTMQRDPDLCAFYRSVLRSMAVHHRSLSDAFWRFANLPDEMNLPKEEKRKRAS
jgi:hypothetical protein